MHQTNSGPRKSHPESSPTEEEEDPWNDNGCVIGLQLNMQCQQPPPKTSAVTSRLPKKLGDFTW